MANHRAALPCMLESPVLSFALPTRQHGKVHSDGPEPTCGDVMHRTMSLEARLSKYLAGNVVVS